MQPFFNGMADGASVPVLGIGDGIAHVLREHLEAGEGSEQRTCRHGKAHGGGLRETDNEFTHGSRDCASPEAAPFLIHRERIESGGETKMPTAT